MEETGSGSINSLLVSWSGNGCLIELSCVCCQVFAKHRTTSSVLFHRGKNIAAWLPQELRL